jgi:uncharacterized protein
MISFSANELSRKEDKKAYFEIDELIDLFDDVKSSGNTKGNVEFQLRNNFIIINGEFTSPVNLTCDRCAQKFDHQLNFDIDEVIEVSDEPYPTEEIEFIADEIHEQIKSDEQIDLEDYIRQYVILNIPSKNLCSEDCTNNKIDALNAESENSIDPRWEKLISYKDKIKGE